MCDLEWNTRQYALQNEHEWNVWSSLTETRPLCTAHVALLPPLTTTSSKLKSSSEDTHLFKTMVQNSLSGFSDTLGEGSKKTNRDQKKTNKDQKKQIGIKKKTNLKTKGGEGRKEGREGGREKERKKERKRVTFSWKMKGKLPSLDPPTRSYFLAGSPCYLLFFFFPSIIVVYLGSFNLDWYPSRLVPMYFFLGTHCGGRRCALPPAPPHPLLF